jgi:hypothetical protein
VLKPEYANRETPGWKRLYYGLKTKPYTGPDRSKFRKAADVLGPEQEKAAKEKLEKIQREKEQKELAASIKSEKQKQQLEKLKGKLSEELKVGDKGHLGLAVKGGTGFEGTIQDIKDNTISVKSKYDPKRIVVGHKDKFTKG